MDYIERFGDRIEYYNTNGELHRTGLPAIEYFDGRKEWWLDGKRHREDGPAIVDNKGQEKWYFKGQLHRTDEPAIYSNDGVLMVKN